MTADTRVTQSPATRAMKAFKQLPSFAWASAALKRHLPAPTLKSTKGTSARTSPSTSSSDSSLGKRGLNGGKAMSNRKISQGKKDAPANARVSLSESSAETTGAELGSSDEPSIECVEPNEAKHITDNATVPSLLIPKLRLKNPSSPDVDVVHSNLAVTWFNIDDHEFEYFVKPKADKDPHTTGSEKQNSLSGSATEANATPNSLLESIKNGYMDELEGASGRVYSVNTPLQQDEKCEDGKAPGKAVVEELSLKTPDVTHCVEVKETTLKFDDGSTSSSEKQNTIISAAAEAIATCNSILEPVLESINNGCIDEIGGAITGCTAPTHHFSKTRNVKTAILFWRS